MNCIFIWLDGGPSHYETFDPKPELTKRDGQRIDIDVFNGNPGPLMKSPFSFKQYGQSGAWVCEKYPNEKINIIAIAQGSSELTIAVVVRRGGKIA